MRNPTFKILLALMVLTIATMALADDSPTERARQEEARARSAETRARVADLENVIRRQTGLVEVTPQGVRRLIATLQEQREQLQLDEAGAGGRRNGLEEAVAKLSKQLEDRVASDDVSRELAAVVAVRVAELQRMKALQEKGAVAAADVSAAEANLATARAQVAAAKQKTLSSASAEALDMWNRQLLELSVASLERQARLNYLEKRLNTLSAALGNIDELEQLRFQLVSSQRAGTPATP